MKFKFVIETNTKKVLESNKQIKGMARYALKGRWLEALAIMLVFALISSLPDILSSFFPKVEEGFDTAGFCISLLSIFLTGPFSMSLYACFLKIFRQKPIEKEDLLCGFLHYGKSLICGAVYFIYTILMTQGTILAIFAIMCIVRYVLVYFIMIDEPSIGALNALSKSRYFMFGNKSKFISLTLSFIGWFLLIGLVESGLQLLFYPEILEEIKLVQETMIKALETQTPDLMNKISTPYLLNSVNDLKIVLMQQILPIGLYAYFNASLACFYELATGKIVTETQTNSGGIANEF